ncbi:MAG: hypothetical protein EZS28_009895 [Streblomastix strix]|uniref:Uncharacterized protein n=1 Tax=Streblomastix strix TaxID=222440 RepID=A0A5J4WJT6_9EUKA|nr:MAG: hypothetical protein EZS28_009895 [Streblomastix strix]
MESDYLIQNAARTIISFNDSYAKNKQGKQNEQQKSDSMPSLTEISSTLEYLRNQIQDDNTLKSVIRIPKLLQSFSALSLYKICCHLSEDIDQQRLEVRHISRDCLGEIRYNGDEQIQTELVNQRFGRVMTISISTAGGNGEEQDKEIRNGLFYIYYFLRDIHEGRTNRQSSFQPLPLLVRSTKEQIEEEGANEEIETQMKNNGFNGNIMIWANEAKAVILNRFIRRG